MHFITEEDYIRGVSSNNQKTRDKFELERLNQLERALDRAYDIRKFEADQYWKRAQYFWAFIVSIYGLYFLLFSRDFPVELTLYKEGLLTVVSVLGAFLCLMWLFANRASEFYYKNWENHICCIEKALGRSLYNVIIADKHIKKSSLFSPTPTSLYKLNTASSLVIYGASVVFLIGNVWAICKDPSIVLVVWGLLCLLALELKSDIADKLINKKKQKEDKYTFLNLND